MALAESDYNGRLALAESVCEGRMALADSECDGRMALVMQEKGLASGELGTHVGVLALGAREGEKKTTWAVWPAKEG